jgi:hypothetical protein
VVVRCARTCCFACEKARWVSGAGERAVRGIERESGVCQVEICSGNKLNDGDAKVPTDSSYTATPGRLGETSGAGEEVSTRVSAY